MLITAGNLLPPYLPVHDDTKPSTNTLSNRINHELYPEPSFPAPQLYLLRHTLRSYKGSDTLREESRPFRNFYFDRTI